MEDLQRLKHQRKKVVFKAFTEALRLQKNIHTDSCWLSANFVNYANCIIYFRMEALFLCK